jgi:DNA mismatch repair protein MutS
VIERSKDILVQLEEEHLDAEGRAKIARPAQVERRSHFQLTLFGPADHPLLDDIRQLDVNQLTPLDALGLVHKWQDQLNTDKKKRKKG